MRSFIQTMITLAASSLGFVAALAWNDAIKAAMQAILGTDESVGSLFIYAIAATVAAIVILSLLARIAEKVGGEASINREVN